MEPPSFAVAELKVMNVVWQLGGEASAKTVHDHLSRDYGYTRGAVYALIHRLIAKGALAREDPGFLLTATVAQESVQQAEAQGLVDRLFGGSAEKLVAALIDSGRLSPSEYSALVTMAEQISPADEREGKTP